MSVPTLLHNDQPGQFTRGGGLSRSMHNPGHCNEPGGRVDGGSPRLLAGQAAAAPPGPRPEHFIVREGGIHGALATIVPLIPVDLLPSGVEIVGVPADMAIGETVGMSNLGKFPKPAGRFQLRFVSPQSSPLSSLSLSSSSKMDTPCGDLTMEEFSPSSILPAGSDLVEASLSKYSEHAMWPGAKGLSPSDDSPRPKAITTRDPPPVMPPARRVLDWAEDTESVSTDDFSAAGGYSSGSSNNKRKAAGKRRQSQDESLTRFSMKTAATKSKDKAKTEAADRMLELAAVAARHRASNTSTPANGNGDNSANNNGVSIQDTSPTPNTVNNSGSSGSGGGGGGGNGSSKKASKPGKAKFVRRPGSHCRCWCQTGQCNWGTDCRYTHQMPVTLEGLADVGLPELPAWWRKAAGLPVEGTIDVRIFSAASTSASASASAATGSSGGGKKSPSPSPMPTGAASASVAVQQSKKAKLRAEREEKKMAEELHLVRLGMERAQATTASSMAMVRGQAAKGRPSPGHVQMQAQKIVHHHHQQQKQQQHVEVEKLVDI